jgi:cyclomaltodextrinase / maltogenic alpha-amylase / neopullulanase
VSAERGWIDEAVVYGVIPRRFGDGGLASVRERLPYLAGLGVTALWLAPIMQAPEGDYGYAVTDYFALRPAPDGGTEEDLRALVSEARGHGIRVLLDMVPNHTSDQHPWYRDAQAKGQASPYWDWYDRDTAGAATYYFDWSDLPNLNFDRPEVRRTISDAFAYWVREFDVDGYRVDACWGVRDRRPDYWPELRAELQRLKPDVCLIAEASRHEPYWYESGFDAAYDWTTELGHWAWEGVFDAESIPAALHERITAGGYRPDQLVFRFLDNNDTGARFLTRYGHGLTRVAATLLLTLPGVPCVYTGSESGAEYEPYRDPEPISFDDRAGLHDHYRCLIGLRRELPALRSREWHPFAPDGGDQVYAYGRTSPDGDPVVVVLNFGDRHRSVALPLPDALGGLAGGSVCDALTGDRLPASPAGRLRVPVDPLSARILTPA